MIGIVACDIAAIFSPLRDSFHDLDTVTDQIWITMIRRAAASMRTK